MMKLNNITLERLRNIINGDGTSDYRSGPKLVSFFNELGFNDVYGQGFPSRWCYTDEKLKRINGTPKLDKCICNLFAPINYIGRVNELDELISDFNKYMAFDKWCVIRDNEIISLRRCDKVVVGEEKIVSESINEEEFLKISFNIDINLLGLDAPVIDIIKERINETEICIRNDAPLAAIILIGSIFEGILLGTASMFPEKFNQAHCAPKDNTSGKSRQFPKWTLNNFIDVAAEIGVLKPDVKKFSHVVRDFRNYIHPYQQMATNFFPDKQTAMICFQVLKGAICQIGEYRKNNREV